MEDNLTSADPLSYSTNGSRVDQVREVSISLVTIRWHLPFSRTIAPLPHLKEAKTKKFQTTYATFQNRGNGDAYKKSNDVYSERWI